MFSCRHQIQHYTGQLAKDSAKHLKDLNGAVRAQRGAATTSEQRQRRLQFDSLQDDFTKALNSFQQVQTQAAQKEKDVIKKARNNSGEVLLTHLVYVLKAFRKKHPHPLLASTRSTNFSRLTGYAVIL